MNQWNVVGDAIMVVPAVVVVLAHMVVPVAALGHVLEVVKAVVVVLVPIHVLVHVLEVAEVILPINFF